MPRDRDVRRPGGVEDLEGVDHYLVDIRVACPRRT